MQEINNTSTKKAKRPRDEPRRRISDTTHRRRVRTHESHEIASRKSTTSQTDVAISTRPPPPPSPTTTTTTQRRRRHNDTRTEVWSHAPNCADWRSCGACGTGSIDSVRLPTASVFETKRKVIEHAGKTKQNKTKQTVTRKRHDAARLLTMHLHKTTTHNTDAVKFALESPRQRRIESHHRYRRAPRSLLARANQSDR